MNFRSVIAAAAVVVGMGSAAEATTVTHNIVFTVTDAYDLTSYYDDETGEDFVVRTDLPGFWGFATGTSTRGTLEIVEGSLKILGVRLVVAGKAIFEADDIYGEAADFYAVSGISGYIMDGLRWTGTSGKLEYTYDGSPDYTFADATISLAPVPLPTTAALLPLGIGALAVIRKRRKALS